jgi:hypothetical protein
MYSTRKTKLGPAIRKNKRIVDFLRERVFLKKLKAPSANGVDFSTRQGTLIVTK